MPRVARLPARDRPAGPERERSEPHVADVELRNLELRVGDADPPHRRPSRTRARLEEPTENVPTSECRRRHEGTGERSSVVCAISWLPTP